MTPIMGAGLNEVGVPAIRTGQPCGCFAQPDLSELSFAHKKTAVKRLTPYDSERQFRIVNVDDGQSITP
jgi:hypothetical protein